jgi:hypothetical protein
MVFAPLVTPYEFSHPTNFHTLRIFTPYEESQPKRPMKRLFLLNRAMTWGADDSAILDKQSLRGCEGRMGIICWLFELPGCTSFSGKFTPKVLCRDAVALMDWWRCNNFGPSNLGLGFSKTR